MKICIVSFPMPATQFGNIFLMNLIEILTTIGDKVYILSSNLDSDKLPRSSITFINTKLRLHYPDSIHPRWQSKLLQFFKIIAIQTKMCLSLMAISPKIDTVIYYIGGANLFPPVLMGKLLRKKVVVSVVGSGSECYKKGNAKSYQIQSGLLRIFERLNYSLADKILVETESAIGSFDLQKYRNKIFTGGTIFLDKNRFYLKKDLSGRERIIGYIGRLDEAKGVCTFLSAIPVLSRTDNDLRFLIGGSGPLYDPIKKILEDERLSEFVSLPGWIPHDMIADYLNDLKILVLPSFSEGLPTIVLEAMACGTPVLATSVGCVPDIVREGETGFLLDTNSPESIADRIREILHRTDLDRIAENAKLKVEQDFSFDITVQNYRNILAS